MEECIFCKLIQGEIPCKKVYEDEDVLAFYDLHPVAPVHILIIPKKHVGSIMEMKEEDMVLFGKLCYKLQEIAASLDLHKSGFRIINNTGEDGGQTVHHVHFHLIGGRSFGWPPG